MSPGMMGGGGMGGGMSPGMMGGGGMGGGMGGGGPGMGGAMGGPGMMGGGGMGGESSVWVGNYKASRLDISVGFLSQRRVSPIDCVGNHRRYGYGRRYGRRHGRRYGRSYHHRG
jgi:hypothetical protein